MWGSSWTNSAGMLKLAVLCWESFISNSAFMHVLSRNSLGGGVGGGAGRGGAMFDEQLLHIITLKLALRFESS